MLVRAMSQQLSDRRQVEEEDKKDNPVADQQDEGHVLTARNNERS